MHRILSRARAVAKCVRVSIVAAVAATVIFGNTMYFHGATAQPSVPQVSAEELELKICNSRINTLSERLKQCGVGASISDPEALAANRRYYSAYYDNQIKRMEQVTRNYEWQLFASNCVLALVALLTFAGISLAAYQLWTGAKLASAVSGSTELEISSEKVRLQSNVVGIAILVISGAFLLFFLRDVYKIDDPNTMVRSDRVDQPTKADQPLK